MSVVDMDKILKGCATISCGKAEVYHSLFKKSESIAA